MGRSPCCSKEGLNRGAWTALEDKILTAYIKAHGEGRWRSLPKRAGLKRCGKSCRLRWLNYLRPDIKRGNISHDEEELIIRLHKLLGNRWSLIAGRLPGRTDNEIKNYWNTTLGKKTGARSCSPTSKHRPRSNSRLKHLAIESQTIEPHTSPTDIATQPQPIRTKALRCTKVLIPALPPPNYIHSINPTAQNSLELQPHQSHLINSPDLDNLKVDNGSEKLHLANSRDSNLFNFGCDEFRASDDDADAKGDYNSNNNLCMGSDHSLQFHETCFEDWVTNCCLEDNVTLDLESLASFLDSEEWP